MDSLLKIVIVGLLAVCVALSACSVPGGSSGKGDPVTGNDPNADPEAVPFEEEKEEFDVEGQRIPEFIETGIGGSPAQAKFFQTKSFNLYISIDEFEAAVLETDSGRIFRINDRGYTNALSED